MANKIKFKIKPDKFIDFISKLDDLTGIEDSIKLKIDNDNIMMYSIMGGKVLLAFKNYIVNTREYLEYGDDIDFTLDIIIPNAKKFVKNLKFIKESEKVVLDITYKESQDDETIMNARSFQIIGGKLKINWLSGEHFEMRDISKNSLQERLNLKFKKWSFKVTKSDFSDVKKLSSINSDKIIHISVVNGKVTLSETTSWELEIDEIDKSKSATLMLNKKFLSCINDEMEFVEFNIFEHFMLIKDGDISNLMLSFEQTFDEDDE